MFFAVNSVHLVFRRLHPREVCGWKTCQRAARFPGWGEKRTRAGSWVRNGGPCLCHLFHLGAAAVWICRATLLTLILVWWSQHHNILALPSGVELDGWNHVFVHFRDLSMILCDPFACNTLVLSIMRNLQELLSQDALPRVINYSLIHTLHIEWPRSAVNGWTDSWFKSLS